MSRARQFKFFEDSADDPQPSMEGFRYRPELITPAEESTLLAHVRELPFEHFKFHGHRGKRRTVSFGWQYEFSGRGTLKKAGEIPKFLLSLRERAASFARLTPEELQHVLVIEYGPGAGIGWHRDRPVFGDVIGVSLLASCVLRFRRKTEARRWERVNLCAEPRSAYFLTGPARSEWEHSILRVDDLRYSVTFRSMRED